MVGKDWEINPKAMAVGLLGGNDILYRIERTAKGVRIFAGKSLLYQIEQ